MEQFLKDKNVHEESKDEMSSVGIDRNSDSDFEASFDDLNRMLHTSTLKLTKGKDI